MVKYCPECGCKVDSDEGYCPKCGSKLGNYKIVNNEKSSSIPKNKKIIILALSIIIIAIIAIVGYTMFMNSQMDATGQAKGLDGKTEMEVYASDPISVDSQIQSMGSDPDFYDNNETLSWLQGLGNNYVYIDSDSALIIMDRSEANKLPVIDTEYSSDYSKTTIHYNKIKFHAIETHSLGSGLKDCILVDQVEVIGNTTKTF